MLSLSILSFSGLAEKEGLLFNQLYIIANTYLLLLPLCLKKKITFEKLLKLVGV